MSLVKRTARGWARPALCWTIQLYMRLVWATNRWTIEGGAHTDRLNAARRPYIGAFWHGRMLMMPFAWKWAMPVHMLISAHPDGRIIAEAVRYFGVDIIPGSSNHGANEALRAMVKMLRRGDCVAVTPDGPDGPAMSASSGAIAMARLAGAPIVPSSYATSRRLVLESWDRFHLPLPFGRGLILIGEPIEVAPEADAAAAENRRRLLEQRLRALTSEADRRMGHAALEPGTMDRATVRAARRARFAGSRS
jgi:lysophospholipid acyltransferase (LPLAT)-like uncharacterized protein